MLLNKWLQKLIQKHESANGNATQELRSAVLVLNPAPYETAVLINDTVRFNLLKFENKPMVFELKVDEKVSSALYGDELKIKQILDNLLSNALKHTERGRITLSIAEEWDIGNNITLVFKVRHSGQGMIETDLNADTNSEMSITRNLINLMHGTISTEDDHGKGTEISVRLPQGSTGSGSLGKEVVKNLRQFRPRVKSRIKHSVVTRESMPYGSASCQTDSTLLFQSPSTQAI
jgi:signal transduction histidine kinase